MSAKRRRMAGPLLAMAFACLSSACMTSGPIVAARVAHANGDGDRALELLDSDAIAERDRLVMLMEAGTIAQDAGRFEDSVRYLTRAHALVESLETVDVSDQTAAVLINDRARRYPGEYSERLWIHTVQMLNFLALDDMTSAAVEARRAIAAFERFGEPVDDDVFTRTLAARILETVGESGSAAIEYARAFEASGGDRAIAAMALGAARSNGRASDVDRYRDALSAIDVAVDSSASGRLWVFIADGEVPAKRAGNLFIRPDLRISFPYYPSHALYATASVPTVRIDGEAVDAAPISTQLGPVAERSLAARAGQVTARQALRVVAKQAVGHAARREDELLGALVDAVLFLLEEADTRGWRTLPARWSFIEVPLVPGSRSLVLEQDGDRLLLDDLDIRRGRPTVVLVRQDRGGLHRLQERATSDEALALHE